MRIFSVVILIIAMAIFHLEVSQPLIERIVGGPEWLGQGVGWVFGFSLGWASACIIPSPSRRN